MKSSPEAPVFKAKPALPMLPGHADNLAEIDALVKVINQQDDVIREKEDVIDKKSTVIAEQQKRIAQLEEYLRLQRARLYGRSSEKNQLQGDIFNEVELTDDAAEAAETESSEPKKQRPKKQGRKPLSPSLPRFQERVELTEAEKAGAVDTFFTKVREELDIIPAKVRVKEILQEKAVFLESAADDQPEKRVIKAAELCPGTPSPSLPSPPVCWPTSSWPNTVMPCHCTGWKISCPGMAVR